MSVKTERNSAIYTVVFLLTAKLKTVPDSLILSCLLLLPGRVSVVFYQVTE